MSQIVINPALADDVYLSRLNRCFGSAWGAREFQWYFGRSTAGEPADLLMVLDDGQPVSGLGLNIRTARAAGNRLRIAIITAAWTAPEARGRSLYTALAQEAVVRAGERGCELCIGFVTADNPSRSGFRNLGGWHVPTWYLRSSPEPGPDPESQDAFLSGNDEPPGPALAISYDKPHEALAQFMGRPLPTECIATDDKGSQTAIVERSVDTDRLLWNSGGCAQQVAALCGVRRRAAAANRATFSFTTARDCAREARDAGFRVTPGRIIVAATEFESCSGERWRERPWSLHNGDRL